MPYSEEGGKGRNLNEKKRRFLSEGGERNPCYYELSSNVVYLFSHQYSELNECCCCLYFLSLVRSKHARFTK